jgi:hypothetical protein
MVAVLAISCRSLASLPNHRDENQGGAGVQSGSLMDIGGCVYIVGPMEQQFLVVWPEGYVREGNSILNGGEHVADVGDSVTLGGSEIKVDEFSFLQAKLVSDVPNGCRGHDYWLASGLADPG